MGNDSGELGHNLMDHHFKAGAYATLKVLRINITKEEDPMEYIFYDSETGGETNRKDF